MGRRAGAPADAQRSSGLALLSPHHSSSLVEGGGLGDVDAEVAPRL